MGDDNNPKKPKLETFEPMKGVESTEMVHLARKLAALKGQRPHQPQHQPQQCVLKWLSRGVAMKNKSNTIRGTMQRKNLAGKSI
ncbi:hypothetical protein AJ87_06905 [Rhizobium yanglingense]|nr:hypothetical protein AJ87_06905 [Rhizobium yanglingense]